MGFVWGCFSEGEGAKGVVECAIVGFVGLSGVSALDFCFRERGGLVGTRLIGWGCVYCALGQGFGYWGLACGVSWLGPLSVSEGF